MQTCNLYLDTRLHDYLCDRRKSKKPLKEEGKVSLIGKEYNLQETHSSVDIHL